MNNKRPKLIFSDFDGTLTLGDELGPSFFTFLELVKKHDIPLVIVTGRSKSWGHFFMTHISQIKYVISENGAVLTERGEHDLKDTLYIDEKHVKKIESFTEYLKIEYPDVPLTADSWGRHVDRAFDLDVLALKEGLKEEIEKCMDSHGIFYSTSSVHLNFWSGDISKSNACHRILKDKFTGTGVEDCLFFGDSLNDESMFGDFPSVGVSNISKVIDKLKTKPDVILMGKENRGPLGVINHLISVLK
ncbi:HAD family hydrolase [Bacteriovoracaceae bacterium]|nr:HAD family hydrolase [Bacteriovoracaceae bacterium]